MVCHRCKVAVKTILEKEGLYPMNITLGEVSIEEEKITPQQKDHLAKALKELGFELIDDKRSKLIEQIKSFIIEKVHYNGEKQPLKLSELLSQHLKHDYSYLSNLFSEVEGITIEQFLIHQKIEKVKEMIIYDEENLSGIAFQMGYSSVAYLSNQFKKVTGFTPTQFRHLAQKNRKSLDNI